MRRRILEIITDDSTTDSHAAHVYDWFMIAVIVVSPMPLCFKDPTHRLVRVEWVTTAIFIVDYLLRWWCADLMDPKGRSPFALYPLTPLAIIDLISIVPTFLPVSQVLRLSRLVRLMRVMRAVKLVHHSRSVQLVLRVLHRERSALAAVLVLAVGYVFVSALIIFNVEPDTFATFFEALYWAVISLSTIGYGDVTAVSIAGRAISMVSAMMGIAVVALPSGIITAGFVEELRQVDDEDDSDEQSHNPPTIQPAMYGRVMTSLPQSPTPADEPDCLDGNSDVMAAREGRQQ